MDKLLYTVEESAEVLSVSRCKVYELVASGDIYSVKIGRSRRVPVDALHRFIASLAAA